MKTISQSMICVLCVLFIGCGSSSNESHSDNGSDISEPKVVNNSVSDLISNEFSSTEIRSEPISNESTVPESLVSRFSK